MSPVQRHSSPTSRTPTLRCRNREQSAAWPRHVGRTVPPWTRGDFKGGFGLGIPRLLPKLRLLQVVAISRSYDLKQAILYGARDLRIEDTPFDCANLQSDQLYAETVVSALSTGTDLGNYLGDSTYVPGAPDYPRRIGYSNVAVVRQV